MFAFEEDIRKNTARDVAERMAIAARTAPKGKGRDTLKIAILTDEDKNRVADKAEEIGKREGMEFFVRDANCVRAADALLLIGTRIETCRLPICGLCGFKNCATKSMNPDAPCVFNNLDLGIAVGSAVSVAADCRVDNRVLYTMAMAALELGILGSDIKVALSIPISVSGKSPFFDR